MYRHRPYTFELARRRKRLPEDAAFRVCWALRAGEMDEGQLLTELKFLPSLQAKRALMQAVQKGLIRPCGPPMIPGARYFVLTMKGEQAIRQWTGQSRKIRTSHVQQPKTP